MSEHLHWGEGCPTPEAHRLEIKGLHVHYGEVCALRDVSFEIGCGHALALVGSNGAGKSTLLKAIAGLVPVGGGTINWRGIPVRKRTSEIAYLPQREVVDWNFPITVRGMIEMGCYSHIGTWKKFGAHEVELVDRAIAAMRLEDIQHRQISALSGGQQQRAFIARALAQEAHVILLDEPFTGLDQNAQKTLAVLMRDLAAEGRLLVASHHDIKSVTHTFDHALLINRTRIAFGPSSTVMTPENLERVFS